MGRFPSPLAAGLPLAALFPLLGLATPAMAGSSTATPTQQPAAAPAPQSSPARPSSTPSLGEALKPSTPEQIALADHLRQRGVIFYGAYWCTHCFRQKNLFGQQAGDRLPYVECAKDQVGADKCNAAGVQAYPTWVFGKDKREGVQTLEELAVWTGFTGFGPIPGKQPIQGSKTGVTTPSLTKPKLTTP